MLMFIVLWSLSAGAQNSNFKPQVVGTPPVQAGLWPFGQPKVLDATPRPLSPQQEPLKPGEQPPKYGSSGFKDGWNDLVNRLTGETGERYNGSSGAGGEYFGAGSLDDCGTPPASATTAFNESKTFLESCKFAQRGKNQKVAINDYSQRPAMMYIYDLEGKCLKKTLVAFGNGAGGKQVTCSDQGSHLSPPGFHLTAVHQGSGKYNPGNSLKMVGLQGQNSVARGVLVHASRAPGTSSTWGCAGVGPFDEVKNILGHGALMYNYWNPRDLAQGCKNTAGLTPNGTCQPDPGSPGIPEQATGQSANSVTLNLQVFDQAHAASFPAVRERIGKGTAITVVRELKLSGTYEVEMVKEEAVGPNVVTPETLRRALGVTEPLKEFKKRIERDTSTIYVLKRDLPLLWDEEIYQLQQKNKSR